MKPIVSMSSECRTGALLANCSKLRILYCGLILLSIGVQAPDLPAQTILRRDLSQLDAGISTFDVDGIVLDDGRRLEWHQIHEFDVDSDRRDEFLELHREVGERVLRLRVRISRGDFANIAELAAQLLDYCRGEPSLTARFAAAALCRGELANGNREMAAVALLRALSIENQLSAFPETSELASLPFEIEPLSALYPDLIPVWFDAEAAKEAWAIVQSHRLRGEDAGLTATIYATSLAIAAGDEQAAAAMLKRNELEASIWLNILRSQQSIRQSEFAAARSSLPSTFDKVPSPMVCVILYYRGLAGLRMSEPAQQQEALLDLLKIPAVYGSEYPEIAAASIYLAIHAELLQDTPASIASLRHELIHKFPKTFHARLLLDQVHSD